MKEANRIKLQEIFTLVLEISPDEDVTKVRRLAESRWDSLAQTSLIAAIESEFEILLDFSEMDHISSFEATCLFLEEKGL